VPPGLRAGAWVRLAGPSGASKGVGIWDEGHVAVRRFREDEGPADAAWLGKVVESALRRRLLPPQTTAWRWIHGENDDLPGIRVDVWGTDLGLVLDAPGLLPLVEPLLDALIARWPAATEGPFRAAWLSWRPAQGEETRMRGLPVGCVRGAPESDAVSVREHNLRYEVRPADGFDAGLYCDMRDVRAWIAPRWPGIRVLNTFAFTGAWSVAAASGGAAEVVTVDLAAAAITRAEQNFRNNNLDPTPHRFLAEDTFRALDRLRRTGERFDVVIADPPSFARGPDGPWSAAQDFPRLIASCLRVLSPGGWLVAATNQGKVSPKAFQEQLSDGAHRAGRRLRILHQASQPSDFPAALAFPESRYLKCWVVEAG